MKLSLVDYPVKARCFDSRGQHEIDMLLLHHGGGEEQSDLNVLSGTVPQGVDKNGNPIFVSTHYYSGERRAFSLVDEADRAWHAGMGGGKYAGINGNNGSIGLESKNRGVSTDPWEDVQLANMLLISRDVQRRRLIRRENILRHKDFAPGRKTDPAGLPWSDTAFEHFKTLVFMEPEPMVGQPDMTLERFTDVLGSIRSPFAPAAASCYMQILAYGIRPTVALAFHVHEGAGKGSIVDRHLNWGAVRTPEDTALAIGTQAGFALYDNPQKSVEDWCKRIRGTKYVNAPVSFDTVEQVCLRYAPFTDSNDPWNYAAAVGKMALQWRQAVSRFYFPETGFAVDDRLAGYWQQIGGVGRTDASTEQWVPGIGFPISPALDAPDGNGIVQWFERGVLRLDTKDTLSWMRLQEFARWERPALAK